MTSAWLVVLNWNGRDDTLALLATLARADLPETTILVVDNGSTDGTLEAVREAFPSVRTLQTGANLGFAGGNNCGIRFCLRQGAEVIGVLNNDTLVAPDFWPPLVSVAAAGHTAVCPDIRYADDPDRSWFFGAEFSHSAGIPLHLQAAEQPARCGLPASALLTGCCLVADAATWRTVGGFDERLFLTFEDSDWCMRARRNDVALLLQPASRITHKVSRSFRGMQDSLALYYYSRNGAVFAQRWFGIRAVARFATKMVLAGGLRQLRRDPRRGWRPFFFRCAGLSAAALGQRGPAGHWIQKLSIVGRRR
jgi:GT2 family glycosyltransferase